MVVHVDVVDALSEQALGLGRVALGAHEGDGQAVARPGDAGVAGGQPGLEHLELGPQLGLDLGVVGRGLHPQTEGRLGLDERVEGIA